jgi:hypothetical protein
MVLIFSSKANGSTQIHREVDRAFSKGVPVIPLRIESVTPSDELSFFVNSVHWIDALTPPLEEHLRQLVGAVQSILPAAESDPGRERGISAATDLTQFSVVGQFGPVPNHEEMGMMQAVEVYKD